MTISSYKYKGIIFDLDGTLLDTAEGVLASVRHTIDTLGYKPLSEKVLRTFIGPPVKRSLSAAYHLSEEEAEQATAIFREQYKNYDLLRAVPYAGIETLLKRLKEAGFLLGVATLKREDYAYTILEHFQLAPCFDSICGSDFASKMQKSDVLKKCLHELSITEKEAVLIGDTTSDSMGAKEINMDFIAVAYGFGPSTAAEWNHAHPVYTADNTTELHNFFLKER